jgi:catechol 2,3-dioxygenase-like lactoylglutathione lyase family enzyme
MLHFDLITLDAEHPDDLAAFWRAAMGLVEVEREDNDRWQVLASADGTRRIGIQRGAHRAGSVHLDLACSPNEFVAEVDRLIGLGARRTRADRVEPYGSIANLADPDGNLFDVCAYVDTTADAGAEPAVEN